MFSYPKRARDLAENSRTWATEDVLRHNYCVAMPGSGQSIAAEPSEDSWDRKLIVRKSKTVPSNTEAAFLSLECQ